MDTQRKTIEQLLDGKDVLVRTETGTGSHLNMNATPSLSSSLASL